MHLLINNLRCTFPRNLWSNSDKTHLQKKRKKKHREIKWTFPRVPIILWQRWASYTTPYRVEARLLSVTKPQKRPTVHDSEKEHPISLAYTLVPHFTEEVRKFHHLQWTSPWQKLLIWSLSLHSPAAAGSQRWSSNCSKARRSLTNHESMWTLYCPCHLPDHDHPYM